MFKPPNINYASKKRTFIRIVTFVFIMTLASVPVVITNVYADANHAGPGISCGHDALCKDIEGKKFDLILYSSLGSEMVILYSKHNIGELTLRLPDSYYARDTGNVRDAIYYLSRHPDYSGFRVRKARKKTGFFSSKVIDGSYVVIPDYGSDSSNRPPEYSFSEENGELRLRIRPVIRPMDN